MKKITRIMLSLALLLGVVAVIVPASVGAVEVFPQCDPALANDSAICASSGEQAEDVIKVVVNTLLFILGAISVLVIIIAGIMYAISGGESANITKAKNMLLYAVIGLVVALLAYAIVNFVIGLFVPAPATPTP